MVRSCRHPSDGGGGRRLSHSFVLVLCTVVLLGGCSAKRIAPAANEPVPVTFLGDSLTRGAQLPLRVHYPALLEQRFGRLDVPIIALNAGFPGDTSRGALSRLPRLLDEPPAILVVAIGTNDGNNEIPLRETTANLRAIVRSARAVGAAVVLVGTRSARPWADELTATVATVAREEGAWHVYDLLAGVTGVESLNLADGVHPNPAGQRVLARNVWAVLFSVVVEVSAARRNLPPVQ